MLKAESNRYVVRWLSKVDRQEKQLFAGLIFCRHLSFYTWTPDINKQSYW